MRIKQDLRKYQIRLIEELKEKTRLLLAVDMGLGKTISCLTAIEELNDEVKRVLIIAPKRVANITWPDELKAWEHLKGITYSVITGNPKEREEALNKDVKIYLINKENIVWLYETNFNKHNFDLIIFDESSALKAGKMTTNRGKDESGKKIKGGLSRFAATLKFTARAKRVYLLTGTPTPNGIDDIWGQIKALDPLNKELDKYLGSTKNKFYEKFFINKTSKRNFPTWVLKDDSFENIMYLIQDGVIKMRSEDYLELPEFLSINIDVELDKKELDMYKELKENLITKDEEIVVANQAVLINKLLQLTSGCIYKEDKTYNVYHTKKIEALKEIIEENPNENILLFYNYKHEKEQLQKHFKDIVFLKKDETIEQWNNNKIKLFAVHPASAGHGLNFQYGGSIMIWMSLFWSLELYQQSNKRLHRSGQRNNVRCYHILAKGTADYKVLEALKKKDLTQEEVFNLMKEIL